MYVHMCTLMCLNVHKVCLCPRGRCWASKGGGGGGQILMLVNEEDCATTCEVTEAQG